MFRAYITDHINLQIRIKDCDELDEATQYFTTLLQEAAWHSTPLPRTRPPHVDTTPLHIRELIAGSDGPADDGNGPETRETESLTIA
jgi:hypothetical protein